MKSKSEILRDILDRLIKHPKLQPANGKTYCNLFVTWACEEYGATDFEGKLANEICDILFKSKSWRCVEGETANKIANNGGLCIAAQKNKPHGHVCIVYPGAMVWSTKWGLECPVVANVGKRNGVMGCNWAFAKEPLYFAKKSDEV